jgi:hypothetical protein
MGKGMGMKGHMGRLDVFIHQTISYISHLGYLQSLVDHGVLFLRIMCTNSTSYSHL